jgi:hypothetical protein
MKGIIMKNQLTQKKFKRSERGNALVLFTLGLGVLATIVGLVVRTAPLQTDQETLQGIASESATAGAAQMKKNYTTQTMETAALNVVQNAGITPIMFKAENCDTVAEDNSLDITDEADLATLNLLDPEVCPIPLRKIVRVWLTANIDEPDSHEETVKPLPKPPAWTWCSQLTHLN